MIITVTPNPAVDKTFTTQTMIAGQVNRMDCVQNIAGGKGINVARVLNLYQEPVGTMGFIGGYTGRFIEEQMQEQGIQCLFTKIKDETRTNINVLAADGYITELLEPGPMIQDTELLRFKRNFNAAIKEASLCILSGSVPRGVPTDFYRGLIRAARRQNVPVLLDTSGELLKEGIKELPFMIKPNLRELEYLSGRKICTFDEAVYWADVMQKSGIEHVMVSMGAKGLLYVTKEEKLFAKAPKITAASTVGCGDSVVAAFAIGLNKGLSGKELLCSAVGISAAHATTIENGNVPKDLADELTKTVDITSI